jgi:uncharacterized membrane protein YbhN (UPF0104 family)
VLQPWPAGNPSHSVAQVRVQSQASQLTEPTWISPRVGDLLGGRRHDVDDRIDADGRRHRVDRLAQRAWPTGADVDDPGRAEQGRQGARHIPDVGEVPSPSHATQHPQWPAGARRLDPARERHVRALSLADGCERSGDDHRPTGVEATGADVLGADLALRIATLRLNGIVLSAGPAEPRAAVDRRRRHGDQRNRRRSIRKNDPRSVDVVPPTAMLDVRAAVPDAGAAGQVNDGVRGTERGEDVRIPVIEVGPDAADPCSSAHGQPVDGDDALSLAQQLRHDGVADETGGTGDHDCHRPTPLPRSPSEVRLTKREERLALPAMRRKAHPAVRVAGLALGAAVLVASAVYLVDLVQANALGQVVRAVLADPLGLAIALAAYGAAFALRAWAWQLTLPGLPAQHAWSALHVALLGNHVLPLRLGEPMRVTSVLRRTALPVGPATASAVTLRAADVLAVVVLAAMSAPAVLAEAGLWAPVTVGLVLVAAAVGVGWLHRLRASGSAVRLPGGRAVTATGVAWVLEAAVVWEIARVAGFPLTAGEAVAVTAATIAAQTIAVTPGGLGSYEAAATAAMVAVGVPASPAFAVALTTHAVKTGYAFVAGGHAMIWPAPTYWGRFRLSRTLPARPAPHPVAAEAPVVVVIPVHNEEATVIDVVRGLPTAVGGRRVVSLIVDDGSTDHSAEHARYAGAIVITQPQNLGLGAAVRRGLAEASALSPAAVVYLDADLEYDPRELPLLAAPVLTGSADYVVGSRFAGQIRRMLPHRRLGNLVLTWWVRWMTRQPITDGQSGYRAFSPRAAAEAEIIHDYNYAQVLTLDLLGKGFRYREVPISYAFRSTGKSFVRLGRYLSRIIPAVHRELNTSVLDDMAIEALPGGRPGVAIEPAVVA